MYRVPVQPHQLPTGASHSKVAPSSLNASPSTCSQGNSLTLTSPSYPCTCAPAWPRNNPSTVSQSFCLSVFLPLLHLPPTQPSPNPIPSCSSILFESPLRLAAFGPRIQSRIFDLILVNASTQHHLLIQASSTFASRSLSRCQPAPSVLSHSHSHRQQNGNLGRQDGPSKRPPIADQRCCESDSLAFTVSFLTQFLLPLFFPSFFSIAD